MVDQVFPNSTTASIHARMAQLRTPQERFNDGNCGILNVAGGGWLQKQNRLNADTSLEQEYTMNTIAYQSGVVPECQKFTCDQETAQVLSLLIKEVPHAEQLRTYCEQYGGLILHQELESLLESVKQTLHKLWQTGLVHNDLHSRNIIIGYDPFRDTWHPWIIDFATAECNSHAPMRDTEQLLSSLNNVGVIENHPLSYFDLIVKFGKSLPWQKW